MPLKTWRVRFHLNRFAPFPYRDVVIPARDKAHAIMIACMNTMHNDWAKQVKRTTASVVRT